MDPNEALRMARLAFKRIVNEEKFPDEMNRTELSRFLEDVQSLADHFEALDQWLSKGGFLPDAWKR